MKYPFSPEVLDAMPEAMAELYRTLELKLLKEIADRLKAAGQLNEVTVQDIRALRSHGIGVKEIKRAIADSTGVRDTELNKLLDDVVKRNEVYYGDLIDLAGVTKPDTLVGASEIAAIMKQTKDEVRNITQSMGFLVDNGRTKLAPADAYQWALDKASLEIHSGAISYGQAISDATRELANSGLRTVNYESGHIDQVDVAVRRAVLTGVTQVCDKYTDESAEYLDSPYVEISAHSGARDKPYPNPWSSHKEWQGKVYYQSKRGEEDPLGRYPDLVEKTGYGEVDGLCGANCRHTRHVWIEGVSERTYTDEELANIDPPPFKYEGKTYTHYEATQEQRRLERTIRKWKRREAAAITPEEKQACQIRIRRLKQEYSEFSKAAGLRTQIQRANVYQPFTEAQKYGRIADITNSSGSNIEDIKITDDAIKKVPLVKVDEIGDDLSAKLQTAHKNLLSKVQNYPVGTEGYAIYSPHMRYEYGDIAENVIGEIKVKQWSWEHWLIHNHPDGYGLSTTDILSFIKRDSTKLLSAIGNNGNVHIAIKTKDFNEFGLAAEMYRIQAKIKRGELSVDGVEKAVIDILSGGKYGTKYYGGTA